MHAADSQQGPKTIKLLVNRTAIGFEDVQDAEEPEVAQVLEVPDDTVREGQPIELRFVRFQSVNSLHVSTAAAPSHLGEHVTLVDLCRIKSRRSRTHSHRFYRYIRIPRRVRGLSIASDLNPFAQLCTPKQRDKRSERVEEASRRLDKIAVVVLLYISEVHQDCLGL
jgi:hypothetical protein